MTVCIAAISTFEGANVIVGSADRLITYGDIEYESPRPKIWQLASHTLALISGNPNIHVVVFNRSRERIQALTAITTEKVADIYAEEWGRFRQERAMAKYVTPLGLDLASYLTAQTNLTPNIANRLVAQMEEEDLGGRVIICGMDRGVGHIYTILDPGRASCADVSGWAAIDGGSRHADQQFIAEGFDWSWQFEDALLLTYIAKKRADITPGVGASTDLFYIWNGGIQELPPESEIVRRLQQVHQRIDKSEQGIRNKAKQNIRRFIEEKRQQVGEQAQISTQTESANSLSSGGPDNAKRGSGNTEEHEPE